MISPARTAAFDVLLRVEADDAFASDALIAATRDLTSQDAGLAEEIALGVLRHRSQLDFLISHFSGRNQARFDTEVRLALRMGIYQIRMLDRIPGYAAVAESVELVKRARKRSAAGLVNAVLRKVTLDPVAWPDRATELSTPAWLLESWDRQFGVETATRIARASLIRPDTYVRLPEPRPRLVVEPTPVPGAFRVLEGDARGLRIQDIGSQSIIPLLGLAASQTLLDLCAAPGNKTAQAQESGVKAVACDLHWHRLKDVTGCERVVLDARRPLPFRIPFGRVLVDAPCSGTGTLARNPEIKWRLRPEDLADLQQRQVQILSQAFTAVTATGRLVYSTCSLERQENEDVVEQVLARQGGRFRIISLHRRTPGVDPGDGFFAAVLEPANN